MLLIPVHDKVNWKHPPVITLLLVMVNVVIFLLYQLDDDQQMEAAVDYYHESGLAQRELPAALAYAERTDNDQLTTQLQGYEPDDYPEWLFVLQFDTGFMRALRNGEVISWQMAGFDEWLTKRQEFDKRYEAVTFIQYGLRTAEPTLISLVSHMFLHGDFWHLFGNMIFLFAVGMLVEKTMSSPSYLIAYLLGGLGAASFDFIFRGDSLLPGIGASGAIAGLMGAYAVLYGLKKIRFFYFIGVYFDYVRLPAIVLLPLWIGNELLQMVLHKDSNINFLAHLGGLCSGALIALVIRHTLSSFTMERVEQDEQQNKLEGELQQVRELLLAFRHEEALPLLRRLRRDHPEHRELLASHYSCSRLEPASDEYHALARAILTLPESDPATDRLVQETFGEYLRMARPATRMNAELACHLARRFIRQKALAEAERLIGVIVARPLPCPERVRLLESFIRLLKEQGRSEAVEKYASLLPVGVSS
ncbi:MAG TPA: rhomboid family intramembrane serine protease [Gammaproteobacteria bacterium]